MRAPCGYNRATWTQEPDLLAILITLDAVVTLIQAVAYDLPRHTGPLDWAVMTVAVLAPTFAATLLWSGQAHRREKGAA